MTSTPTIPNNLVEDSRSSLETSVVVTLQLNPTLVATPGQSGPADKPRPQDISIGHHSNDATNASFGSTSSTTVGNILTAHEIPTSAVTSECNLQIPDSATAFTTVAPSTASAARRKAVSFGESPNSAVPTEVVFFKRSSLVSELAELPEVITRKNKTTQDQQVRESKLVAALHAAVVASSARTAQTSALTSTGSATSETPTLSPPLEPANHLAIALSQDPLSLKRSGSHDQSRGFANTSQQSTLEQTSFHSEYQAQPTLVQVARSSSLDGGSRPTAVNSGPLPDFFPLPLQSMSNSKGSIEFSETSSTPSLPSKQNPQPSSSLCTCPEEAHLHESSSTPATLPTTIPISNLSPHRLSPSGHPILLNSPPYPNFPSQAYGPGSTVVNSDHPAHGLKNMAGNVGGLHALCVALGCDHAIVYRGDPSSYHSHAFHHRHRPYLLQAADAVPSDSKETETKQPGLTSKGSLQLGASTVPPSSPLPGDHVCLSAIYKQYCRPRSVLKRREEDSQLQDARARIVLAAIAKIAAHRILRRPMSVLKLSKEGEPIPRYIWVSADGTDLCWAHFDPTVKRSFFSRLFSKGETRRDLSSVRRIALGTFVKRREAIKMKPRSFLAWRCVTIEWAKIDGETPRKSEIVCPNDDACRHLFMGLQALIPLTRYHISYPRFLWRRARLRALARAYEHITRIEDILMRLWQEARISTGRAEKENKLRTLIKERIQLASGETKSETTVNAQDSTAASSLDKPVTHNSPMAHTSQVAAPSSDTTQLVRATPVELPSLQPKPECRGILDAIRNLVSELTSGFKTPCGAQNAWSASKQAGCCLYKVIQDRINERRARIESAAKSALASSTLMCKSVATHGLCSENDQSSLTKSSTSSEKKSGGKSSSDDESDLEVAAYEAYDENDEEQVMLRQEQPHAMLDACRIVHSDLNRRDLDIGHGQLLLLPPENAGNIQCCDTTVGQYPAICMLPSPQCQEEHQVQLQCVSDATEPKPNSEPEVKSPPVRHAHFDPSVEAEESDDDDDDDSKDAESKSASTRSSLLTRVPTGRQALSSLTAEDCDSTSEDDATLNNDENDDEDMDRFNSDPCALASSHSPSSPSSQAYFQQTSDTASNHSSAQSTPDSECRKLFMEIPPPTVQPDRDQEGKDVTPESPKLNVSGDEAVLARADKFIRFVRSITGPLLTGFEREFVADVRTKALALANQPACAVKYHLEASDLDDPEFRYITRAPLSPLSSPLPHSPTSAPSVSEHSFGVPSTTPSFSTGEPVVPTSASRELLQNLEPTLDISEAERQRLTEILGHVLDHAAVLGHHGMHAPAPNM